MAPSNLSAILRGKKGLSRLTAITLASRLHFSEQERKLFVTAVESEHARSATGREKAAASLSRLTALRPNLAPATLEVVGDWRALAILECLRLPIRDKSPSAIAQRMGISESDVQILIDKLHRLAFLEKNGEQLKVREEYHWGGDGVPSNTVRRTHDQVLAKARDALFSQDTDQRDFSFMMMTFDRRKITDAKKDLRDFLKTFTEKYSGAAGSDCVYSLGLQLFNLTPLQPKESSL